ncbi:MAG: DeoR family transcriptional regulator [Bacteroidota bacterium]
MSGKVSEKTSEKIVAIMNKNQKVTIPELSNLIGVTARTIERNIQKLKEKKRISRVGGAKNGHWKVL